MRSPIARSLMSGPPVLRRTSLWCAGLAVACVLGACFVMALRSAATPPRPTWSRLVVMALGFMPMVVIFPVGWWVHRGIRRGWLATGGRLCMHCAYDVTGLPERGVCPECGNTYDLDADARHWQDVGLHRPTSAPASSSPRCTAPPSGES